MRKNVNKFHPTKGAVSRNGIAKAREDKGVVQTLNTSYFMMILLKCSEMRSRGVRSVVCSLYTYAKDREVEKDVVKIVVFLSNAEIVTFLIVIFLHFCDISVLR